MAGQECYECGRWFGVCHCPAIPPMRIENPFAFVEMFEKGNMMLIDKITKNQVTARKNRQTTVATLLTTLLGEANMVAKNAQRDKPTDEEVTAVLKKFLKGNAESQAALRKAIETQEQHHPAYVPKDLLDKLGVAGEEQIVLEAYLPKQLSQDELTGIVQGALTGGVEKNVGALMGFLKARYAGQYDGKVASAAIKSLIG
jgi:uncharacterized protein YqeY